MRVEERLLSYVVVDTQSDEQSTASPSTEKQLVLAEMLKDELQGLGIENAHVDAYGVVYGKLEANAQGYPAIGLNAHMDTATDLTGTNVRPRIIRAYDGGIIDLNEEIQMDPAAVSDPEGTHRGRPDRHRREYAAGGGRQGRHRHHHDRPGTDDRTADAAWRHLCRLYAG